MPDCSYAPAISAIHERHAPEAAAVNFHWFPSIADSSPLNDRCVNREDPEICFAVPDTTVCGSTSLIYVWFGTCTCPAKNPNITCTGCTNVDIRRNGTHICFPNTQESQEGEELCHFVCQLSLPFNCGASGDMDCPVWSLISTELIIYSGKCCL